MDKFDPAASALVLADDFETRGDAHSAAFYRAVSVVWSNYLNGLDLKQIAVANPAKHRGYTAATVLLAIKAAGDVGLERGQIVQIVYVVPNPRERRFDRKIHKSHWSTQLGTLLENFCEMNLCETQWPRWRLRPGAVIGPPYTTSRRQRCGDCGIIIRTALFCATCARRASGVDPTAPKESSDS